MPQESTKFYPLHCNKWVWVWQNLQKRMHPQRRLKSACASTQTDQSLLHVKKSWILGYSECQANTPFTKHLNWISGVKIIRNKLNDTLSQTKWTASSEFGTYSLCEQRRFRRACASAQSRQNLRCSLIQAVKQEEPSDRKPDPWPLWMAGHAQWKFVMTECSKTQIRLTGPK